MKQAVVFINGWAIPDKVLQSFVEALAERADLNFINLPGLSEFSGGNHFDWHSLIEWVDSQTPEKPFTLAGWSYGGVLASAYASRYAQSEKVKRLITLATNPSFIKRSDWREGMSPEVFSSFVAGIQRDVTKQLYHFFNLCSMGNRDKKGLARMLWQALSKSTVKKENLLLALELLGSADIRQFLSDITCPVTHFYGDGDILVPSKVGLLVKGLFPHHEVKQLKGGHCFFLNDSTHIVESICQVGGHK